MLEGPGREGLKKADLNNSGYKKVKNIHDQNEEHVRK
jgi:hypothetical protein